MGFNVCSISGERRRHDHLEFVHRPQRLIDNSGCHLCHDRSAAACGRICAAAVQCHELASVSQSAFARPDDGFVDRYSQFVLSPTETGTATSTADDFSLDLRSIFDLSATTISSTSSVNGTPFATGSTTIADLSLTVAGQTITFSGTPSANDVIFSLPGLTVTLNQQMPDTTETAGIITNAIAINFTNFAIGPNHVTGAVDIGQSMVSIGVIPEPATWVEMLAGFGAVGLLTWGRTRTKGAARV